MNMLDLIELEQDIATGINTSGATVSNKDIFNNLSLLGNKLDETDKLRLLLALHSSIDIEEKNFSKMADTFQINSDLLKAAKNLKWLGININKVGVDFGGSKGRREAKQSKEKIQEFKTKTKNIAYNICRSAPKLESVVHSCSQYQLSKTDFPFVEEPKDLPKPTKGYALNAGKFGIENENEKLPNLIVFVLGGISHNEICSLEKLSFDKKLNHHLILGSTSIISAKDFIDQLNNLPGPNDNLAGIKLNSIEIKIN